MFIGLKFVYDFSKKSYVYFFNGFGGNTVGYPDLSCLKGSNITEYFEHYFHYCFNLTCCSTKWMDSYLSRIL